MSAASLDDYTSANYQDDSNRTENHKVLAERTRILEVVARKAQEKTLTLQETTDLYTKFNNTYEASNNSKLVDESWALELLQESEREDISKAYKNDAFQTRVNGIPHNASGNERAQTLLTQSERALALVTQTAEIDEPIMVEKKAKLRHQISFEPYHARQVMIESKAKSQLKAHQTFAVVVGFSGITTLSILLGFAWFF